MKSTLLSSSSLSSEPQTGVSPSISNSPLTCISDRTSQSYLGTLSGPSSPALSSVSDVKKRHSRSISAEPQDVKRIREEDNKFENLLSQFIQPRSEEQVFCSFLQSRLEKLEKTFAHYAYYNARSHEY